MKAAVNLNHTYRGQRLQTQKQRKMENPRWRLKQTKAQMTRSNHTNLNSCDNTARYLYELLEIYSITQTE